MHRYTTLHYSMGSLDLSTASRDGSEDYDTVRSRGESCGMIER